MLRHSDYLKHRGILLVISSPSGAGKTTITHQLLAQDKYIKLSTSVTTRLPRPGEEDGVHYHFRSQKEFEYLISAGAFLEHSQVFGHHYGTLKIAVETGLEDGFDILFDIDWQGAQKIDQEMESQVISVFILTPDLRTLEKRLKERAQDEAYVIAGRMSKALDEMSHWAEYDYVIVNDDLEKTVNDIRSILRSERLKRTRQVGLSAFVNSMAGRS